MTLNTITPKFQIQLFGDFYLTKDGTAITGIDTARLQSVFCFLVVNVQKPQPRHYIASVLWQDSTESQARTNLRKYIHQLRDKLPELDQLLIIGSNIIQWCPDAPALVDVHAFEHYLHQARESHRLDLHEGSITALEQAVALYRGDLLPACYEEWIALPREQLASKYMQALDKLAQLLEQQCNYDKAIHYVHHLLERDVLRESSYRRLIHLYALEGNQAKAIEAFYQCADVLRREMDIEPGAATRALYERVKKTQYHFVGGVKPPEPQRISHRKQMTMVYADIAGFSALSERYDLQTVFTDLNVYMNFLSHWIQEGKGQVVKRMGDAVLGMFDQPEDALNAAFTIQNQLRNFNSQQYDKERPPFHTRIGMATGEVMLANLDIAGVKEIEIIGKCVNLAVHLQAVTPVDGIAIDQLTYTHCKSFLQDNISESLLTSMEGNESVYILDVPKIPWHGISE